MIIFHKIIVNITQSLESYLNAGITPEECYKYCEIAAMKFRPLKVQKQTLELSHNCKNSCSFRNSYDNSNNTFSSNANRHNSIKNNKKKRFTVTASTNTKLTYSSKGNSKNTACNRRSSNNNTICSKSNDNKNQYPLQQQIFCKSRLLLLQMH